MWKSLILEEKYYLVKVLFDNCDVTINISDFITLWSISITRAELIAQFELNNPLYEGTNDEIHTNCCCMLNDPNTITGLDFDETECTISLKMTTDILPLKLKFILQKRSDKDFKKSVTIPMVQTIQYLEFKQKKLETLLAKKDKELLEYKHEYGEITRKVVETETYVPDLQPKEELLLQVFSRDQTFLDVFGKSNGDVQQMYPEIKEEKIEKRKLTLAPSKSRKRVNTKPS